LRRRPNEPPLPEPLAYFLTWPTYGTWLPGDERGWVEYHHGWQAPDPVRRREAEARMTADACILDAEQRQVVEATIEAHCRLRGWQLHAVNCRTNHVHVVVTAPIPPKHVQIQFKSWSTRRLKELERGRRGIRIDEPGIRKNWWAERGSRRWINDEQSLEQVVLYVRHGQDRPELDAPARLSW
jgi:REP element-mobilizing transposase RayT